MKKCVQGTTWNVQSDSTIDIIVSSFVMSFVKQYGIVNTIIFKFKIQTISLYQQ